MAVALLSFICKKKKKKKFRTSHRQVSRSTPFPESAFFSCLISALEKEEGKKNVAAALSYIYFIYIYRSENQYCTDIAINFTCCITQTGKKVKAAELNGAEDISQQFSDEVSGELKMYRKTSQPACKQVGTFFFGKYNC